MSANSVPFQVISLLFSFYNFKLLWGFHFWPFSAPNVIYLNFMLFLVENIWGSFSVSCYLSCTWCKFYVSWYSVSRFVHNIHLLLSVLRSLWFSFQLTELIVSFVVMGCILLWYIIWSPQKLIHGIWFRVNICDFSSVVKVTCHLCPGADLGYAPALPRKILQNSRRCNMEK